MIKSILLLSLTILAILVASSDGQYSYTGCDSIRLLRCQQDIMRDLQTSGLNSASIQYAVSGPPYSPTKLTSSQTTCRLVRSNLDCLLQTTPNCYDHDLPAAKNTDYILRGKRFLEENGCNDPDGNWRQTNCYRSPELRICEDRYLTGVTNSNPYYSGSYNFSMTCPHYYRFKACVDTHIRMNCKVQDTDMSNEYLIDKAADHTWRCSLNSTSSISGQLSYTHYLLNNSPGTLLSPIQHHLQSDYEPYQQRPAYIGSSNYGRNNWLKFQNPTNIQLGDNSLAGIGRYPADLMNDRLIAPNADFDPSDCTRRAGIFVRECDNRLSVEQAIASSSPDIERRSCW